MEELFNTSLSINGQEQEYHVVFDHENYIFQPRTAGVESFSFQRDHDSWTGGESLDTDARSAALDALDRYLLKQH